MTGNSPPVEEPLERSWLPGESEPIDHRTLARLQATLGQQRQLLETGDGNPVDGQESRLANLDSAAAHLATARQLLQRLEQLQQEIAESPELQAALETSLAAELPPVPEQLDDQLGIEVHQATLAGHQQVTDQLRADLAQAESRMAERIRLLAGLGERRAILRQKLQTAIANHEQLLTGDSGFPEMLVENQAVAIGSRLGLMLCDVEQAWCGAVEGVGPLRRDHVQRQLVHAEATRQAMDNLVGALRSRMARIEEERAQQARRAAANSHPLLQELAAVNSRLARERSKIAERIEANRAELDQLDDQLESLDNDGERLKSHVQVAGHSETVGIMLRHQRSQLTDADTNRHRQRIREIKASMPDISLQQLEIREQRDALTAETSGLHSRIKVVDTSRFPVTPGEMESRAEALLATKRKYLNELSQDFESYIAGLSLLEERHEQAIEATADLRLFIDQHVLWIRSAEPLDSAVIRKSIVAIGAVADGEHWQDLLTTAGNNLSHRWPLVLMIGVALWLAFGMRKQLDRRLRHVSRRRNELRFSPILRSLALTLLQASFLPGLVASIGWLLRDPYDAGSLQESLSLGLLTIVPELFIGCVIHRLCIDGGLAESQLGWPETVTTAIRKATGRIMHVCLPLLALACMLESFDSVRAGDSLGRLVFIGSMLAFSWASFGLVRELGRYWKRDRLSVRGFWIQSFGMWAPVVVLAPLALAGVAAMGYHYSSVFLSSRLLMTWWILLGVISVYFLASRMVDIGQNIMTARRRWIPQQGQLAEPRLERAATVDDRATRMQVRRLLHVSSIAVFVAAAMALWIEVLPAIGALDIGIWGPIERQVRLADEETGFVETFDRLEWITIGDLLACGLILAATILLSRNLPGLLELVLLNRLPLDRGGKYAISIVCRYLLGAVGMVIAFRTIGFSWHSVQWLVAAMGVGLGFGLQEIFANFVSGIIILLERPVRVGDFITVNGTTGFVTRVQLRATTIIDYDRRELIVPNKKFITDDVINWTLTDPVTRIVIPVGIAYGSDTRQAQASLLKVARQHPEVLRDPPPQVIFTAFGGSSLDFELRVHIPNRERYPEMLHALHMAIDDEFRRQKIEIAFPQQDVHLKGLEPLWHQRPGDDSGSKNAA